MIRHTRGSDFQLETETSSGSESIRRGRAGRDFPPPPQRHRDHPSSADLPGTEKLNCDRDRDYLAAWRILSSGTEGKMNTFDRNLNLDGLFKFSQISYSTQQHLKKVYSSLAICMFMAAAGGYVHVVTRIFQGGLLSMLISLGLMMWLSVTPHNSETEKKRLLILSTFAFFTGTGLGPLMDLVISINPTIIPTAFLISALVFCCFTLSALYAQRRSYLFLGGILMSLLTVLCLLPLVNLIFGSVLLVKAQLYIGLLVFCGFILFDTQLIIEKAENGDKDYIWHCVDLFMDFIAVFRKLMFLLALNEKEKKRRTDSK